jgi:hypothetical protein
MNDDPQPPKLVSRKTLADTFDRSERWVAEVTRRTGVANYGGRYDVNEVKERLRAGYRPFRRQSKS